MSLDRNWTEDADDGGMVGLSNFRLGWGIGKRSPLISFHGIIYRSLGTKLANMCEIGSILNQVTEIGSHILLKRNRDGDRLRGLSRVTVEERKTLFIVDLFFLLGLANTFWIIVGAMDNWISLKYTVKLN